MIYHFDLDWGVHPSRANRRVSCPRESQERDHSQQKGCMNESWEELKHEGYTSRQFPSL